jgi:alpha-beta hydrolase superfamily lysophospholipase
VARLALKDELLDAQLVRTAGSSPYGGSDLGECLAAASRVRGTDLDSWYLAWDELGRTLVTIGDSELEAGRSETARACFFRASSYLRTAGVMLMARPLDERLVRSNALQTETFRRGAALLDQPPDIAEIAFEHTTLPGYFFRAPGDGVAATLILLGGYDGTAEELYFLNGAAALARGYNVLAFDGPGQGSALIQQHLLLRPDYESVVGAVIDHLLQRPETDPNRIALIGLSLGAHLAPRAASGEHRLAACVADCGSFDLFQSALERIPSPLASRFQAGSRGANRILERILNQVASKPTAGWALRRGQLVHGTETPLDYLLALRDYSLTDRAETIQCPTLVCHAEDDDISASAPQLINALRCPKASIYFTADEGANDHCEAAARTLYHARTFAWLDPILNPTA